MTADRIIDEARTAVARGDTPDWSLLRDRIRALGGDQRDALRRLERIAAVHRARSAVPPTPPAAAAPPLRAALRTRPTLTGNMDVRRGDGPAIVWTREPAVAVWELRISARPDPRRDYEVLETRELPGDAAGVELPLGEAALRVHLLGRDRSGRLVRRAIVSGLSRETWGERWQRRPSAS